MHGGDIYRNKVNIDFSVNVSPYGIPDAVRSALNASLLNINNYPDPYYEELTGKIAAMEEVLPEKIVCGNGASELLDAVVRVIANRLSSANEELRVGLLCPSFTEYERSAKKLTNTKGRINRIYLKEEKNYYPDTADIDALLEDSNAVILGNPNNPTGRLLSDELLESLIAKAEERKAYIILDESFIELTEAYSYVNYNSNRLIRIKSFTKSMSIPGVRIGYAILEDTKLCDAIREELPCWNVSIPAMYAGIAATECRQWLRDKVSGEDIREEALCTLRSTLSEGLRELGIKVYPSDTNFILIRAKHNLYTPLLDRGILIRNCDDYEGLSTLDANEPFNLNTAHFYRIAVRKSEDNNYLINAIAQIMGANDSKDVLRKAPTNNLMHALPSEIEGKSFEILTSELSKKGIHITDNTAPIIKRCIHTSADFEYAATLDFSEGAVDKIKELIRNGAHIVTDTNMALAGINKSELAKYGGKVHCFMADETIAKIAKERGITRAAASMEHAATRGEKIIFAVGNAPTALITLCEMMDRGEFTPEFVIGVPVGFVNVVYSKEMIIERGIPHIVNRGRKGGSNIAAAIVNAILYDMRDETKQ